MICAIFFCLYLLWLMQTKEKSSSGDFSTGGDLAVDGTLSPPGLQMPNGKAQRKESSGGG